MSEFLDLATTLFLKHRRPMSARDLIDLAIDEKLLSDRLSGKTPHQTMKAKLSTEIVRHGAQSRFVRTAPGRFYLRELLESSKKPYEAKRYEATPARERVMVFPSKILDHLGRFQGVKQRWKRFASQILKSETCRYLDRIDAEQREDVKQVLTYVIVTRRKRILAFRRGTFNRVEDYLRGSACIGFGGHVAESDRTLYNLGEELSVVRDNAIRELFEEIELPQSDRERLGRGKGLRIIGLLER